MLNMRILLVLWKKSSAFPHLQIKIIFVAHILPLFLVAADNYSLKMSEFIYGSSLQEEFLEYPCFSFQASCRDWSWLCTSQFPVPSSTLTGFPASGLSIYSRRPE